MNNRKSWLLSVVLSFFGGIFGLDRFYLGYTGLGVLKLCTGGGFGFWYFIDLIRILTKGLQPANGLGYSEDYTPEPYYEDPFQYQDNSRQMYQQSYIQYDPAEELAKYKKLLDDGAITEEEYNQMKRNILGLDSLRRF